MNLKILIIADDSNFTLSGDVIRDFSEIMAPYHIKFKEAVILPDTEKDSIMKVMSYMAAPDSLTIVCGGMKENSFITQEAAAAVFKRQLVRSKDAADLMNLVYESAKKKFNPSFERACNFLEKSFIIPNQKSGISGFYITEPVFFAAIPLENKNAQNLFKSHIIGKILSKMGANYSVRLRKYKLFGLRVKEFERLLKKLTDRFDYEFAYDFIFGEIIISVHIGGISTQKLNENIKNVDIAVLDIFKDYHYGYDDDELHTVCSYLLKENNATIAVAESLTGGFISDKLTDMAGASSYFIFGGVVYSDFSKAEILGIPKAALEKYGAVSENVAMEMAKNVRNKAMSDIGIAVTGFAGPETPGDNYPVGTVFIALSSEKVSEVRSYNFSGGRIDIKSHTAKMALFWIFRLLRNDL